MNIPSSKITIETILEPFYHIQVFNFFTKSESELLLNYLKSISWNYNKKSFYKQYDYVLEPQDINRDLSPLFSTLKLDIVKERMESYFQTKLYDFIKISFHKLIHDQYIGIHTDSPSDLGETHRLIIQLNDGWDLINGGLTFLHSDRNFDSVSRVLFPVNSSGFGFKCSDNSYHSVSRIKKGIRYSIVFNFWERNASDPPFTDVAVEIYNANKLFYLLQKDSKKIDNKNIYLLRGLEFLNYLKTTEISHSERNLFDHLYGTFKILYSWNTSLEIQLAGLFHSIYGTKSFNANILSILNREMLIDVIGEKAEHLVFLYCVGIDKVCDKYLKGVSNFNCWNHKIQVDQVDIDSLYILEAANIYELYLSTNDRFDLSDREIEILTTSIKYLRGSSFQHIQDLLNNYK